MPSRRAGVGAVNWQINGWINSVWLVNMEMVVTEKYSPSFVTPTGGKVSTVLVVPTRLVATTDTILNPHVHAAGMMKKSPDGVFTLLVVVVMLVHTCPAMFPGHGPTFVIMVITWLLVNCMVGGFVNRLPNVYW